MNPPVLATVDREEAERKAAAYEFAGRKDPEYSAAAEIYRLLAEGKRLIDVGIAIREGGFDEKMRPRLAIARADRRQVEFIWQSDADTATFNTNSPWSPRFYSQLVESINFNRRHGQVRYPGGWGMTVRGFALVPMIPADVRPRGDARNWHILWEVEQWADERIGAQPPTDPYLLRRVRGDLFEVLAEWDLTEVEKHVMAGRAKLRL